MWVRQLLSTAGTGCNRWCDHRTYQAGTALVVSALNSRQHWDFNFGGRSFSSSSSSRHQDASQTDSIVSGLGDSLQQCSASLAGPLADAANSSSSSSSILSSFASSSDISSSISQILDVASLSSFAAQPFEPIWQLANPVVLGCSVWESMHSMTGLPWWATIPLTTFALRTSLLYLTLKAKSAGLNFVLAQQATQTATNLLEHWKQQQPPGSTSSTDASSSSNAGQPKVGLGRQEELIRPSRWRLTRMYYRYYRKQYGTTSLWWWTANIFVQLNVFLAMSASLRQMAATQWPGFTDQGLWWFTDLTYTSVALGTANSWGLPLVGMHAPGGAAGFLLPFACVVVYNITKNQTPLAQQNVWVGILMDIGLVAYTWFAATAAPQATLLYWLSNNTFYLGLQNTLARPSVVKALGLPAVMLPHPKHDKEARERAELEALRAQQLVCGSEDVGFLRYLAASYLSRGLHQQALQCLQRLTMLSPGDADAFRALGNSAAELQQWVQSARAFERAAELHAVAVDRREHVECLMLAAKQWLNATAEARAMQKRAGSNTKAAAGQQQQQQDTAGSAAAAADGGSASSSSRSSSSTEDKAGMIVQPSKQQEYINKALVLLQQAVHYQDDGADAFYLLSMAQAADGKWEPSLEAATTFWNRSLALAENDQTARINAAAKLLPVLNNLCKQRRKQKDYSALLTVGQLAAEVAKCGWDRQTEESLRETFGAAAQAANQQDKTILSQQLAELQQQFAGGVVRHNKR